MEFIRGTTLVHLGISLWSGAKTADREKDIKMGLDGKLPPKELLSMGCKSIYPKEALRPMSNRKKAAERACLAVGTKFMGGYAIPDEKIPDLEAKLDGIQKEFDEDLREFLSNYDVKRDQWLESDENKEYAYIFEDQIPSSSEVKQAYNYKFTLFKFDPAPGYTPSESDIANQILHEIGNSCREISKRLIERSKAISGGNLREQFQPLIEKLDTLSFGNGKVLAVLREFRRLQDIIPLELLDKQHPVYGQTVAFVSMCDTSDKLLSIADGQLSVFDFVKTAAPLTQTVAAMPLDVAPVQAPVMAPVQAEAAPAEMPAVEAAKPVNMLFTNMSAPKPKAELTSIFDTEVATEVEEVAAVEEPAIDAEFEVEAAPAAMPVIEEAEPVVEAEPEVQVEAEAQVMSSDDIETHTHTEIVKPVTPANARVGGYF